MKPSEHPKKLKSREKVGKDNAEGTKKVVAAARAWAKEARKIADEMDTLADAMEEFQAEELAYQKGYFDVVGVISDLEAQYDKEKDAKKQEKIEKNHEKMNKTADEMIDELNNTYTKGLKDSLKDIRDKGKLADYSV